jgi:hypothetical protein
VVQGWSCGHAGLTAAGRRIGKANQSIISGFPTTVKPA